MSDIVQRLRALVILDEVRSDNPLGREAADHIDALETALQEIAEKSNDLFARNIARIAVEQEAKRMRDDWVDLMFKTFALLTMLGMGASLIAILAIVVGKGFE